MSDQRLTGTDDRPTERLPDDVGTLADWAVMLGGPAIWISHFMLVYLAAEGTCSPTATDQWEFLGTGALVGLTLAATAAAAVACAGVAVAARRRMRTDDPDRPYVPHMAKTGLLLAVGATIGVLAVGIPAAYLTPVC